MRNLALDLFDFDTARHDEHVAAVREFLRYLESHPKASEYAPLACIREMENANA